MTYLRPQQIGVDTSRLSPATKSAIIKLIGNINDRFMRIRRAQRTPAFQTHQDLKIEAIRKLLVDMHKELNLKCELPTILTDGFHSI